MIFERCQRAGNSDPALDDDDRNGQQVEQSECGISNPFPTTDRSKDDGGLSEYDEQDVRHVEADGCVSRDSIRGLHSRLMRQARPLFPPVLVVWPFLLSGGRRSWLPANFLHYGRKTSRTLLPSARLIVAASCSAGRSKVWPNASCSNSGPTETDASAPTLIRT